MSAIRYIVLLTVVLFGAYSNHVAKIKIMNNNTSKTSIYTSAVETGDVNFMKRAMELSHVAARMKHGDPFGCVVVQANKIIGEGWSRTILKNDPSAHAEVEAIRDACGTIGLTKLEGCILYTSAQPCPMCLSLIYLSGIEKVFYCIPASAFHDSPLSVDHIYNSLRLPVMERPIPEIQMMREEVDGLINSYKAGKTVL